MSMCFSVCSDAFVYLVPRIGIAELLCYSDTDAGVTVDKSKTELLCHAFVFTDTGHVDVAAQVLTEEDSQVVCNDCRSGAGGGAGSGKPQFVSANAFRGSSSRRPTQVWRCPGYSISMSVFLSCICSARVLHSCLTSMLVSAGSSIGHISANGCCCSLQCRGSTTCRCSPDFARCIGCADAPGLRVSHTTLPPHLQVMSYSV